MNITKEKLVKDLQKMEKEFLLFHKESDDGLLRTKGITKNLVTRLRSLFPEYDEKLIKKIHTRSNFSEN